VSPRALLWPVVAMVALTFAVTVVMYRRRIAEIRAKRIRPQSLASAVAMATQLENTSAADNYRNLFESPVLFYAAAVVAYVIGAASPALVALMWAYVALRVVHSVIHCTSNRVIRRFQAFGASLAVLLAIWAVVAWNLAAGTGP
jgi:hypothetical protein